MNGLQQEYDDRVAFNIVDIDEPDSKALKEQYGFRVQPYFVLLDVEGNVTNKWYGIVPADDFHTAFDDLIPR